MIIKTTRYADDDTSSCCDNNDTDDKVMMHSYDNYDGDVMGIMKLVMMM